MEKNILVPIDFKEPSVKAANYACLMADKFNAGLILLYVIDTPGLLAQFFSSGDHLVKITDEAKEKMYKLANALSQKNEKINIKTKVERGKPYQKILEIAKETGALMIILGENHHLSDTDDELGTTIYHITLKSPIPVLTIKGDTEKMNDRILVPLDLTKKTSEQLSCALYFGTIQGATIYLVSSLIGGIEKKESRIYKKLKEAKKALKANGVKSKMKLFDRSETPPFMKVLQYAEKIDAGMILIMTHQEGYTHDNYIGAFAHHILNKSKVPVLSITSLSPGIKLKNVFKVIVDPIGLFAK